MSCRKALFIPAAAQFSPTSIELIDVFEAGVVL
jgi:hypothetical protein